MWQTGIKEKLNAGACLQGTKFAGANKQQLAGTFAYLEACLEQVVKDNELGALRQALKVQAFPYIMFKDKHDCCTASPPCHCTCCAMLWHC